MTRDAVSHLQHEKDVDQSRASSDMDLGFFKEQRGNHCGLSTWSTNDSHIMFSRVVAFNKSVCQ